MLDLRGKPYLQVAHRLVWFREDHSDWAIKTFIVEHDAAHAIFRAEIVAPTPESHIIAQATGHETKLDFADFIEKAETKAIGRALALCGYGTQFAPELDEGDRLADTPTTPAKPAKRLAKTPAAPAVGGSKPATLDQKKEIVALVKAKLGAKTPEEVLPAIIEHFPSFKGIKSSDEINQELAIHLIKSLESIK